MILSRLSSLWEALKRLTELTRPLRGNINRGLVQSSESRISSIGKKVTFLEATLKRKIRTTISRCRILLKSRLAW